MSVLEITKDSFHQEVLESDRTVLLDFWASWCGPCRMLAPIVDEVARERPDVKVCKIDVDKEQELAATFQVTSIPTLVVIKNGKTVKRSSGAKPKQEVLSMLD